MIRVKLIIDKRTKEPHPIKIYISKNRSVAYISTGISVSSDQWDSNKERIINHSKSSVLNGALNSKLSNIQGLIVQLTEEGRFINKDASFVKRTIEELTTPTPAKDLFIPYFEKFITKKKKINTIDVYNHTLNRINAYTDNNQNLLFSEINTEWLHSFNEFLSDTSPSQNARNIHLRNIRAVFNDAISNEVITCYPFRKFKIRPVKTAKRSLSLGDLRKFLNFQVEKEREQYHDIFKLIFYLVGINIVDLCNLKEIRNGRIEYYRAKTNRLYSIKVEPEALEIINKYKGDNFLLNILDRYNDYRDYRHRLNENLQKIGRVEIGKHGKKTITPLHKDITTYWARHTWATIAASLDIPKETIAAALGHGGNSVTDIYIDFDQKKIDEANRKVLDYVLYGK